MNTLKMERTEKLKLTTFSIDVNGVKYSRDLLTNPITDQVLQKLGKEIDFLKSKNKKWEQSFSHLQTMSDKAIALEKAGNYEDAIIAYELCIEYGKNSPDLVIQNYASNIDRLFVLYRKNKDYQKEVSILEFALSHEIHTNCVSRYVKRLKKAKELLSKAK